MPKNGVATPCLSSNQELIMNIYTVYIYLLHMPKSGVATPCLSSNQELIVNIYTAYIYIYYVCLRMV